MTALEVTFIILAVLGFAATAWVTGLVAYRLFKVPKR
jgi:hypothetical protein